MSQPPLFSDPKASDQPADPQIASQMKRYLKSDLQPDFRRHLLLKFQDPFAQGLNGSFKLSAVWAGIGVLAVVVLSVFVYFNF